MKRLTILVGLSLTLWGNIANAWETAVHSDAQLAEQSEIIAVGHVKNGSLIFTQYPSDYISHAIFVTTTFIKGDNKLHEIPIILSYGLLPVPFRLKDKTAGIGDILKEFPSALREKGPILLFEDNPSEGCTLISNDIYQDQIWLLRQGKASVSQEPSPGLTGSFRDVFVSGLGVWEPQDLQPLAKENDFKKLIK
jgi:hypothetical protein